MSVGLKANVDGTSGTVQVNGNDVVTVNSSGITLAGKLMPNVQSVVSADTVTPNANIDEMVSVSAQAVGLTFAAPSGTPSDGQKLTLRVKDNGVTRAISWNAAYVAGGAALPTATTAGKWHHIGFIYNTNTTTWLCVAATVQA